jgi:molybdopterin molybdotransferase
VLWKIARNNSNMTLTYQEALGKLRNVAETSLKERNIGQETVPLLDALGRVAAEDHVSPIATPPNDTSAMDGYAINSNATMNASADNPVTFVVKGTLAAGDEPIALSNDPEDGVYPCVEIMTGAQFPQSTTSATFDACVKIEDTVALGRTGMHSRSKAHAHIAVKKPLPSNANRRYAGGDMQKGDLIVPKGQVVRSPHIMALASVGVTEVVVQRKLRVAVWSTGNELSEGPDKNRSDSQIFNSNGPYLCAALRELGVNVEYQGILSDHRSNVEAALNSVSVHSWDLIITTGAVSKGKFDFMLPALEELRADMHFHGVSIRPGHPVLFATTKRGAGNTRSTPVFGLPGNPIATSACFRFLVVPFLRLLVGQASEQPQTAELLGSSPMFASPSHLDCFRHGTISNDDTGRQIVVLNSNQSPAIISHFAGSNCWVHLPRDRSPRLDITMVYCYSHIPLLV